MEKKSNRDDFPCCAEPTGRTIRIAARYLRRLVAKGGIEPPTQGFSVMRSAILTVSNRFERAYNS